MTNPQEELIGRLRGSLVDKDNFPRMKQERCASRELVEQTIAEIQRLDRLLLEAFQGAKQGERMGAYKYDQWLEVLDARANRHEDEK